MSTALCRWWLTTGRLAEGRRWLAAFTARAGPRRDDAVVARAWSAAAMLATENGDYQPAIELAARALRVLVIGHRPTVPDDDGAAGPPVIRLRGISLAGSFHVPRI